MMGLTKRQRVCLDTLVRFQKRTGTMPSVDELRKALGLASKSAAARLLLRLEHRGAIKRIHGSARAITLKKQMCPHCGKDVRGPR